ncbi:hypothetical protein ElyMa_006726300 [Elysia marginata]|uniref:Uncharacterized protein n=1 Tax=Elysia marginata TaxID=1093978 RepID=A0AAV4IUZ5_9GAST|nr:hypothetical protein ElyMa_006726300 [Elysia marginata]
MTEVVERTRPQVFGPYYVRCDVIVGNVDGARSPEDPDMSVMVGAAMTRAQTKRDAVTKPLRVPDMERHGGVDLVVVVVIVLAVVVIVVPILVVVVIVVVVVVVVV